jgi:hypothetical protein
VAFGTGPQLAAQCPRVPAPDGWKAWSDADGPIPDALAARARAISGDQNLPLGVTESFPLPGVVTLIRVEPRAWDRDAQGNLVEGCFRVGAVYLPAGVAPPATTDSLSRTIGILTAISLAVGTVVTIATWRKK